MSSNARSGGAKGAACQCAGVGSCSAEAGNCSPYHTLCSPNRLPHDGSSTDAKNDFSSKGLMENTSRPQQRSSCQICGLQVPEQPPTHRQGSVTSVFNVDVSKKVDSSNACNLVTTHARRLSASAVLPEASLVVLNLAVKHAHSRRGRASCHVPGGLQRRHPLPPVIPGARANLLAPESQTALIWS